MNFFGLNRSKAAIQAGNSSKQLFAGIAAEHDVQNYLSNTKYQHLTWETELLEITKMDYTEHQGNSQPQSPMSLDFWEESKSGADSLILEWQRATSKHFLLIMYEDVSTDLTYDMTVYIQVSILVLLLGIIFVIFGFVALIMTLALLYFTIFRKIRA